MTHQLSPILRGQLSRAKPKANFLYTYTGQNPVSRGDPSGLWDEGDKGGGGSYSLCPLVAQTLLSIEAFGALSVWLCIYDCNMTCPRNPGNFHTEIQWDLMAAASVLSLYRGQALARNASRRQEDNLSHGSR